MNLVFEAPVSLDGELFNPMNAALKHNSARHYNSLPLRYWDEYVSKERTTLWYAQLLPYVEDNKRRIQISAGMLNILHDTGVAFPPASRARSGDDYDVSRIGVALLAPDLEGDPCGHYGSNVHWTDLVLPDFECEYRPPSTPFKTAGFYGACLAPVISPNGYSVAFIKKRCSAIMRGRGHVFLIQDVRSGSTLANEIVQDFNLSPHLLRWSRAQNALYAVAEETSCHKIFRLSVDGKDIVEEVLHTSAYSFVELNPSVLDVRVCSTSVSPELLVVTMSSLVETSFYRLLYPKTGREVDLNHEGSRRTQPFKFNPYSVSRLCWEGEVTSEMYGFLIKPSHCPAKMKYPVAMMIHDGPASSWKNLWTTSWNPMVFAEAGYIVVLPNITGSTGYGNLLVDAINGELLGRPYRDLERCFKHIARLPCADTSRAVALGAGYVSLLPLLMHLLPLAKTA